MVERQVAVDWKEEPVGVEVNEVEVSDDKTEVVVRFEYAARLGVARLRFGDDGLALIVNERLSLTGIEQSDSPPIYLAEDDDDSGYTLVELSAVAELPAR
jgi:hypothetical protein